MMVDLALKHLLVLELLLLLKHQLLLTWTILVPSQVPWLSLGIDWQILSCPSTWVLWIRGMTELLMIPAHFFSLLLLVQLLLVNLLLLFLSSQRLLQLLLMLRLLLFAPCLFYTSLSRRDTEWHWHLRFITWVGVHHLPWVGLVVEVLLPWGILLLRRRWIVLLLRLLLFLVLLGVIVNFQVALDVKDRFVWVLVRLLIGNDSSLVLRCLRKTHLLQRHAITWSWSSWLILRLVALSLSGVCILHTIQLL